ncbi:MAG: alpha/beta hydrolase [Cyanobacteria bacterium P01_C01_bin.120]
MPTVASFAQVQQQPLTDGMTMAYRECGTGTPVIMLHGLADHSLVWQSLATYLSDRYRCFAPDLRGHGDSSKPASPAAYQAQQLADDLESCCQRQQLGAVHVVAHSWAAKVALIWAQQAPTRLQSLTLADPFFVNRLSPVFRPTFPLLYRALPFLRAMGPFPDWEQAQAMAQTMKQYRGWSDWQQAIFRGGMAPQLDGQWRSKFAIAARNGVFADVVQTAGLTVPLTIPTLLLLPTQGLNRMAWQTRPYYRYLPQLESHSIPGHHWPHLADPDAFNQAVAAFLTRFADGCPRF